MVIAVLKLNLLSLSNTNQNVGYIVINTKLHSLVTDLWIIYHEKRKEKRRRKSHQTFSLGDVYIEMNRSSKSLFAITEAHYALINFWINKKVFLILKSLSGNQNKCLCFFCGAALATPGLLTRRGRPRW